MKRWQFWLGVAFSAIFLYFVVRKLEWEDFWAAIKTAQYLWIIPGVLVYFGAVWARAWRWHYLLKPIKSIPTRLMFPVTCIGYMGNNIYPARAGEVLRAVILKRKEGVPVSASLATVIVERIFDGVVMLAFIFVNLTQLKVLAQISVPVGRWEITIQDLALWGSIAFLSALLIFLLAAMFPRTTAKIGDWVLQHLLPSRLLEKSRGIFHKFLDGLASLRSPGHVLMVFFTSVVIWLLETVKYWFVLNAFSLQGEVTFFTLMLMNGVVNLATTIPAAPGYLGTFDAPGIAVLQAGGISQAVATGYTLVLHVALWVPITLLGAWYLAKEGVKWSDSLRQESQEEKSKEGASEAGEVISPTLRTAIVGAGFAGMAAAYDLRRAGHSVTIFEAQDQVGGLAGGFKEPGWEWSVEKFYHHWFASDRHMLDLIKELGWQDKVIFPRPLTVMYHDGQFYPFDSIIKALLFPGLGFGLDKIRFGLVGVFLRLTKNWRRLEKYTVETWMTRWAGKKVYQMMWEPLLIGKFGQRYHKQVTMAWMWARIKARTTRLGTFEGGFQNFADQFAARLQEMGVEFRLRTAVTSIRPAEGSSKVVVISERVDEYDRVLVTLSPRAMSQMVPTLPQEYLSGLTTMHSMGAVVLVVALKHSLSQKGYYWYNLPKNAGFPFLALVEHTNFIAPEKFNGDHIVYMGDYLEPDHEYFKMDKDELLSRFLPALEKINPDFEPDWVKNSWLFRTPYAQPVPLVDHSRNIPTIETPLKGIFFASMSQVYPWDRGTNFAVEIGRQAARLIMK